MDYGLWTMNTKTPWLQTTTELALPLGKTLGKNWPKEKHQTTYKPAAIHGTTVLIILKVLKKNKQTNKPLQFITIN